jgi:hypothetical protein
MALPLALLWIWQTGRAMPSRRVIFTSVTVLLVLVLGIALEFPGILAGPDEASVHATMLWRLLALVVWPVGLTIDHDWLWVTSKLAAFGAMAWFGVVYRAWLRPTLLSFALVWPLVALLPRLFAHEAEPLHEHHLYGPMIGLSLGVAGCWPVVVGSCHYWLRCVKCAAYGHAWLAPDQHWCMRCRRNESFASGGWIARQAWIQHTDPRPSLPTERAARYARFKEHHA